VYDKHVAEIADHDAAWLYAMIVHDRRMGNDLAIGLGHRAPSFTKVIVDR
jgi:hypothetical protein